MNTRAPIPSATSDAISHDVSDLTTIRWAHYLHGCISGLLAWLAHHIDSDEGILLLTLRHHVVTGPSCGGIAHIALADVLQHRRPTQLAPHNESTTGPARGEHSASTLRTLVDTHLTADTGDVVLAVLIGDRMSRRNVHHSVVEAVAQAAATHNVRLLDIVAVPRLTPDASWTSSTHAGFAGVVATPDAVETRTAVHLYGLPSVDGSANRPTAMWLPERYRIQDPAVAQRRHAILYSLATAPDADYHAMTEQARRLLGTTLATLRRDPSAAISDATVLPLLVALDDLASGFAWDMLRAILGADPATSAAYDRLLAELVSATHHANRTCPAMLAGLITYLRGDGMTAAALLTLAAQEPDNHWVSQFRLHLMHGTEPTRVRTILRLVLQR
jgi:hypothetical protein